MLYIIKYFIECNSGKTQRIYTLYNYIIVIESKTNEAHYCGR